MKVITIFNFPNEDNYNKLCHWWLKQALENTDLPIEIWHSNNIDHLDFEEMSNDQVSVIQKQQFDITSTLHPALVSEKAKHNVGFKLYNLCNEVESFIFIDADAIIFKSLETLVEAARRRPFIAVDHQDIPGHTSHIRDKFLNSGVQVCSLTEIFSFEHIIQCQNFHKRYLVPGTDQSMLWTYFKYLEYDYTDSEIDWRWNNCAGFCDNFDQICINHYWYKFKPWTINCPKWNNFIKNNFTNCIS